MTSIHVIIQDKFRQASKSGTRIRVGVQLGFYIGFIFRVEELWHGVYAQTRGSGGMLPKEKFELYDICDSIW